MSEELRRSRLQWIRRELDQVGNAMALVGTHRSMLLKMSNLIQPVSDGLHGERPEVKSVREDLQRAQHNLKNGPTTPLRSSRNVWKTRDLIDKVIILSDKGLLDVPATYEEGQIVLDNLWGYTNAEVQEFKKALKNVLQDLDHVGLAEKLEYGVVVLQERKSAKDFMARTDQDIFVVNLSKRVSKNDILSSFADRIWFEFFSFGDRGAWSTKEAFANAFTRAMRVQVLSREERAYLQITVGKIATRWPTYESIR